MILDTHFIPVHSVVPHIIQVIFLAQLVMTDQSIREKFNRGPNVSETDIFFLNLHEFSEGRGKESRAQRRE